MPVRAVTADDLKCRFGCCRRVILEIKTELLQASKQGLGLQHGRELILKYFLWLVELRRVEFQWDLSARIHTEVGIKALLSWSFLSRHLREGSNIAILTLASLWAPRREQRGVQETGAVHHIHRRDDQPAGDRVHGPLLPQQVRNRPRTFRGKYKFQLPDGFRTITIMWACKHIALVSL